MSFPATEFRGQQWGIGQLPCPEFSHSRVQGSAPISRLNSERHAPFSTTRLLHTRAPGPFEPPPRAEQNAFDAHHRAMGPYGQLRGSILQPLNGDLAIDESGSAFVKELPDSCALRDRLESSAGLQLAGRSNSGSRRFKLTPSRSSPDLSVHGTRNSSMLSLTGTLGLRTTSNSCSTCADADRAWCALKFA
jgi:hypothetical protein